MQSAAEARISYFRAFRPDSRPLRYWMDWYERRKNLLLGARLAVEWQLRVVESNCILMELEGPNHCGCAIELRRSFLQVPTSPEDFANAELCTGLCAPVTLVGVMGCRD